jgi:hypothetical protein
MLLLQAWRNGALTRSTCCPTHCSLPIANGWLRSRRDLRFPRSLP